MSEPKSATRTTLLGWALSLLGAAAFGLICWNTYTSHVTSIMLVQHEARDELLVESVRDLKAAAQQIVGRAQYERDMARHAADHNVLENRLTANNVDLQELKIKIAELNLRLTEIKANNAAKP